VAFAGVAFAGVAFAGVAFGVAFSVKAGCTAGLASGLGNVFPGAGVFPFPDVETRLRLPNLGASGCSFSYFSRSPAYTSFKRSASSSYGYYQLYQKEAEIPVSGLLLTHSIVRLVWS
jgi:hypothetical protein